jgi:Tfp pilus assembly protein PilF
MCLGTLVFAGCASVRTVARKLNGESRQEFEAALTMGQVHEQEGKLQKAAEIYKTLHEQDAEQPVVCHRLGVVQMGLGNEAEGILLLEQANLLEPDNADVLNDLGYAYVVTGEIEQGEELLRQAYALEPGSERTTNNLALAAGMAGRYDESLAMYEQVVTKAEALANLGYIAVQRGEGPQAVEYYSRALDLDPELTEAGEALAQLAEMKREVDGQPRATEQWAARQAAAGSAAHVAETPPVEAEPTTEIKLTGGEFDWAE